MSAETTSATTRTSGSRKWPCTCLSNAAGSGGWPPARTRPSLNAQHDRRPRGRGTVPCQLTRHATPSRSALDRHGDGRAVWPALASLRSLPSAAAAGRAGTWPGSPVTAGSSQGWDGGPRRRRVSARRRYSKRTLPGLVMRRSSGSVTVMTPNAMTRPVPISA